MENYKDVDLENRIYDSSGCKILDFNTSAKQIRKKKITNRQNPNKTHPDAQDANKKARIIDISYIPNARKFEKIANELIFDSNMLTLNDAKYQLKIFYDKLLHLITVKEPFSTRAIELFIDRVSGSKDITYFIQDLFDAPESQFFKKIADQKKIAVVDIFEHPYDGLNIVCAGIDIEDAARVIANTEYDRFFRLGKINSVNEENKFIFEQMLKLGLRDQDMIYIRKDMFEKMHLAPELYYKTLEHLDKVKGVMNANACDLSHGNLIRTIDDIHTDEIFAYVTEDVACIFDEKYVPKIKVETNGYEGTKKITNAIIPDEIKKGNKIYHKLALEYFMNDDDSYAVNMARFHAEQLKNKLMSSYFYKKFCQKALHTTNIKTIEHAARIAPLIGSSQLEKKIYLRASELWKQKGEAGLAQLYMDKIDHVKEKGRVIKAF